MVHARGSAGVAASAVAILLLAASCGARAATVKQNWVVTARQAAPDSGVKRNAIFVNGQLSPALVVHQGDTLEITVVNMLPADWPTVLSGVSIHWHGFHMKGNQWYDGSAYLTQCPIQRGERFTYKFQVMESPGTYVWHDHTSFNRADGLQGPLVVLPPRGSKTGEVIPAYNSERTLFMQDWWHFQGGAMSLRLNRPFDDAKVTNDTGSWFWIGLPKSILVNGKGSYNDCEDVYKRKVNATLPNGNVTTAADIMAPNDAKAGQLGPAAAWPLCKIDAKGARETVRVKHGETVRMRLVNGATLVYMTVCFQGHNVTAVAADGMPIEPQQFYECVDVNAGQRLDVLLKANQPVGNYWITVAGQYRKGAPSAYAVLSYNGASKGLPSAAIQQPDVSYDRRWPANVTMSLKSASQLASGSAAAKLHLVAEAASAPKVPQKITRRYVIDTTQPLLQQNGLLKWALDNVIHAVTPSCEAKLDTLKRDPQWAVKNAMRPNYDGLTGYVTWPGAGASLLGNGSGVQVFDTTKSGDALQDANTPKAGTHIMSIEPGEVIEIVLQNNRAGAFGGEYEGNGTSGRNGAEQHPFHMHGYRFFVVGMGSGTWNESAVSTYNLANPVLRDTVTLLFDPALSDNRTSGWTAIRFQAHNPGAWAFHCHIQAHAFMGQALWIVERPDLVAPKPSGMPKCPVPCRYQLAPTTLRATNAAYGANNAMLAPNSALP